MSLDFHRGGAESADRLQSRDHFHTINYTSHELGGLSVFQCLLQFPSWCLQVFILEDFSSLARFISGYVIFYEVILHGIFFLNYFSANYCCYIEKLLIWQCIAQIIQTQRQILGFTLLSHLWLIYYILLFYFSS